MTVIASEERDGVLVLRIDRPPVNALDIARPETNLRPHQAGGAARNGGGGRRRRGHNRRARQGRVALA
jgi:hypothetical protein